MDYTSGMTNLPLKNINVWLITYQKNIQAMIN